MKHGNTQTKFQLMKTSLKHKNQNENDTIFVFVHYFIVSSLPLNIGLNTLQKGVSLELVVTRQSLNNLKTKHQTGDKTILCR